MKLLPKVTQRYVFLNIKTFETLSVMPYSQFLEILNQAKTSK